MCFYEGHYIKDLRDQRQYISMTSVNTLRVYNTEIQKEKIVIRSFHFSKSISTYTLMNNKTKHIKMTENY